MPQVTQVPAVFHIIITAYRKSSNRPDDINIITPGPVRRRRDSIIVFAGYSAACTITHSSVCVMRDVSRGKGFLRIWRKNPNSWDRHAVYRRVLATVIIRVMLRVTSCVH